VKLMAHGRIKQEILCRLLLLLHLLRYNPNLTPEQFFRVQVNGGSEHIANLVIVIKHYTSETVQLLLTEASRQVRRYFQQGMELIIAVDEASLADYTLPNALISPTAINEKVNNTKQDNSVTNCLIARYFRS
jgi:hypothetical protein